MKGAIISFFFISGSVITLAQKNMNDSLNTSMITVFKDPRLDILAKKETEFNVYGTKLVKGYRLLVMKSNDRDYIMSLRAQLLQNFPDQKVYMTFQAPFIKLKFGNFLEKADAEKFRDMILKGKFVSNNIYVIQEVVEIKPDKNKEPEIE